MTTYLVLVELDYSPTGKHYHKGDKDTLDGWRDEHIASALRAKQIKEGEVDGRSSRSQKRIGSSRGA